MGRRRSSARRAPARQQRPPVRLYLEGETENRYFADLCTRLKLPVRIWPGLKQASRVVKRAVKDLRRSRGDDAPIWCVFDHEHPNMADTMALADKHHIRCAVSNPCFELWLLLHFQESPGAQDAKSLLNILRKHLVGYDKRLSIAMLRELDEKRRGAAMDRARKLHQQACEEGEPWRNPVTTVYELVEFLHERAESRSTAPAVRGAEG